MVVDWWFARLRVDPVPVWFRCLSTNSSPVPSQVPSGTGNAVRLGTPIRCPDSLQKITVPQFEDQPVPNSARMVAALPKVLVEQSPYAFWIEVPSSQSSRLKQNRHDQVPQFIPNPVHQRRQGEARLRPVQHWARHPDSLSQLAETRPNPIAATLHQQPSLNCSCARQ